MTPLQQKLKEAFTRHQAGDIGSASTLYREVLQEDEKQPDALHMMGIIAQQKGNTKLGLELIELALSHKPDMALAWHNKSLLLRVMGRKDEALEAAKRAIGLDGAMGDAQDMAGSLLREMGRLDEAAPYHAKAVALQPDNGRYRSNYAVLLMAKGDLQGAYNAVKDSESLDRDSASFALGNVLRAAGYTEKSIPHYERVGRLANSAEARMNEAMARLLVGDFGKAWDLWKALPDEKENLKHIPKWQGEKVRHLLLHEEQGLGDAIQCVRYIPMLRDRAEKITLKLSPYLQKLMKENFPDCDVLTLDDPVPAVDARAQLMQLPAILNTSLATIPNKIPYLHAREEWRTPWRERLGNISAPRFGVVWAGNPNHRNNRNRSLDLSQIKVLLEAGRKHAVSLQKWGKKDEDGLKRTGMFDADPWLDDFTATAGLMMELDLIITVDTAVAHLAGALGKPVWVLIPFDPDWRWMLGREDSPWYPTMRLFRQDKPRDWSGALTRMAGELGKLIGGERGVLHPQKFSGEPLKSNPLAVKLY